MLKLVNIKKVYTFGAGSQTALDGVSVEFRKNEFVSVLGPSGCGKTTLLNIIGGLDRYTSGDLIIKGKHTVDYKDGDWDVYRNRSVGFVFQSYNLIPHQSILANVELAMTLSGIKRSERRARAKEALEKVGLGEYVHKKPNQLSGGQMQRVAIARALVNNPEILLADEPTGALDSETSVQIMELLKEIAADRLVIMVTHNPELAEKYSTRIISLLDGKVVGDTNPYTAKEEGAPQKKKTKKKPMSFLTATGLSLNNLMTKKARTFLTSFAGSIGIIGIALILSLSNGISIFIDKVQEDTLSSYPLTIESETMDFTGMFLEAGENAPEAHERDAVYSNSNMQRLLNSMMSGVVKNDLGALKEYLEADEREIDKYVTDIKYTYASDFALYMTDGEKPVKVDAYDIVDEMYMAMFGIKYTDAMEGMGSMGGMASSMMSFDIASELLDDPDLLESQYDLVSGDWPSAANEMVLVIDENNEIMDMVLYALGLRDRSEIEAQIEVLKDGGSAPVDTKVFTYEELMGTSFTLLCNADRFTDPDGDGIFTEIEEGTDEFDALAAGGMEMRISGIVRPAEGATAASITGVLGYTKALTEQVIDLTGDSPAAKAQESSPDTDIFTGIPFPTEEEEPLTMDDVRAYLSTLPPEEQQQYGMIVSTMDEATVLDMFTAMMRTTATYEGNLEKLGVVDKDVPASIAIYPKDFDSKEVITGMIDTFNEGKEEAEKISYTDYIGLMMTSVTTIIDVISYVLIAFVSISLVVSSIMIGIITYISVLERTKEIGILRSIGASKKDISRVFNAETLIVGLAAGLIGILCTLGLCVPINIIIRTLSGIPGVGAQLPWQGGVALVLISCALTFIAGLIPAKIAAKKDPVVALRSE